MRALLYLPLLAVSAHAAAITCTTGMTFAQIVTTPCNFGEAEIQGQEGLAYYGGTTPVIDLATVAIVVEDDWLYLDAPGVWSPISTSVEVGFIIWVHYCPAIF